MSDWADDSYATEPRRRGRLLPLVLILLLVIAVGALAYVGLQLGAKALRFAGGFTAHTVHSKNSPDGAWALVVDTFDKGALGGSTTVSLKPAAGDARSQTLYDGDWLPDAAVRWRDARTVSISGQLQMPFIVHHMATGSAATSGATVDGDGYVRNAIAPGERVALLSGLSAVLPAGVPGNLLTRTSMTGPTAWQRLLPADRAASGLAYAIVTYREPGSFAPWNRLRSGTTVASSHGGRVEVRWNRVTHTVSVVTTLSGYGIGVISRTRPEVRTAAAARRVAKAMWRELSMRGVGLP